jgi:membrane glycosyltransferase
LTATLLLLPKAVLISLGWAALTLYYTPSFFWWLTPIFAGLLLAPLLVRWTSSPTVGCWSRRIGLFLVPSEIDPIPELRALDRQAAVEPDASIPESPPPLPPERPRLMPVQQLDRGGYITSAATSP